ncbi:MAG: ImmA/IrrE family metallo-endopeptidase [Chloroflexota bacterium]
MQINPHIAFISKAGLEEMANALLDQYAREIEPIARPPVPVEKIADFLLELNLEWLDIPDTELAPILAYLDPGSKTIRLNERRLAHFEQYPGTYEFTLAHEIGHYQLHVLSNELPPDHLYLCRDPQTGQDRREWQAERFASYLLLPLSLLLPAVEGVNLNRWPALYRLRDQFKVSITALRIRLEELGYLYVTAAGRLYPDRAAAAGEQRQEVRRLISQGQLNCRLGQVQEARQAYRQALDIARAMGDRRQQAYLAWELGLLEIETDPVGAAELMSICVAYEREIGHPQAEADAERVARLKKDEG